MIPAELLIAERKNAALWRAVKGDLVAVDVSNRDAGARINEPVAAACADELILHEASVLVDSEH